MDMPVGLASRTERDCLRGLLSRQLVPLALLIGFVALIAGKAAELDLASVLTAVAAIGPLQWLAACLGAAASFWAVGRMEVLVHRLMGTGTAPHVARITGVAAVATAQITGFGLLTGTLARWRLLPGISLWKAAQITGMISLCFMLALGVLAAMMVLATGPDIAFARPLAGAACLALALLVAASLWRPRWLMRLPLPPLRAQLQLLVLALLDTGAAALTLYVLIPEAQLPPLALFYTVFLLALGAGLLGTTPGGAGPFELVMLLCLPHLPEASALAAIMGYRLVYFALPAGFAAAVLIFGLPRGRARTPEPKLRPTGTAPGQPVATGALSYIAARAEAGLMRQGEFGLLCDAGERPLSLVAPAGQSLIMLSDPISRHADNAAALRTLHAAARQRFLTPCLYKCGARTAATARAAGWTVLNVATEAHVDPARYDLAAPAARQLRRHLRKAEKSGVTITEAGPRPPLAEMRRVARDWAAHRGGARGFSMGRFDEDYVTGQRVYLAHRGDDLIGFITLHESWREQTLDLMCHGAAAPAGTMQLLVHRAITSAAHQGCARLSLAAVPRFADSLPMPAALATRLDRLTGADGLIRFKSGFSPTWEPLYLAAPGPLGLALAGLDLADRILRPRGKLQWNS